MGRASRLGQRLLLASLLLAAVARAPLHAAVAPSEDAPATPVETHPDVPGNSAWAGVMVLTIIGLFIAAAVIGPVVRANHEPDPLPPTHSYDEPPGSSHHHGREGVQHFR